ncbi:hypothetical protein [Neolewinella persica]|uniref:hypothetical protein n=1 Tax=Neolewinella persica TaxID=70998 RepID=UPI00036F5BB9|nr:hypothetical protein [Neolewinella persica]
MTKTEFLTALAEAYDFAKYADYTAGNLDSADECLADARAAAGTDKLDIRRLFEVLLKDATRTERAGIMVLLDDYLLEDSTTDPDPEGRPA